MIFGEFLYQGNESSLNLSRLGFLGFFIEIFFLGFMMFFNISR